MKFTPMIPLLYSICIISALQQTDTDYNFNVALPKKPPPPAKCYDHCRTTCKFICKLTNLNDLTFLASIKKRKKPRTELDVSFNHLKTLKKNDISSTDFKIIRRLHLEHNQITSIDPEALDGLDFLKELYLTGNQLVNISIKSFKSFTLEVLILDSCGFKKLPGEVFKNTPNLKFINLNNNSLTGLAKGLLNNLQNLEEIHVGGNFISELSKETFKGLGKLKVINMTHNRIVHLEEDMFRNLKSLKEVQLADNLLARLDANTFKDNIALVNMDLANNFIEAIPERLFETLKELRSIKFNNNKLKTLKMHIFKELMGNSYNGSIRVGTEYVFSLEDNPWDCEGCDMFNVFNWLRVNTTQDYQFKWSVMICATPERFKGKSWTFVPWNETETNCVEPPSTRNLTETTEVSTTTYEVYQTLPMMNEVKPRTPEATSYAYLTFSNETGEGVMEYIKENSNICVFQYYFLGCYALFVFISACAVWVIIYKEKVKEMNEERFYY